MPVSKNKDRHRVNELLQTCKPDPVVPTVNVGKVIIYLFRKLPPGINLPTHQHRTSRPQSLTYVAFQHARFTRAGCYHQAP